MTKLAFCSPTFGEISKVPLLFSNVKEKTPFFPTSSSLTRVEYGSPKTTAVP